MQTQTTRRTPEDVRWIKAAGRAIGEGVRVFQLAGSGQWIATSGSEYGTAYELDVTGSIAHGCSCLAGLNDDPVCKHRASWYLSIGALTINTPEASRSGKTLACTVCGGQGSVPGVGRARNQCSACEDRGRFPREQTAA